MLNAWTVVCFLLCTWECVRSAPEPGSCSASCSRPEETKERYHCSCSSSCALYRDCCYDSPFKPSGAYKPLVSLVCLPISGIDGFLAVNSCPSSWTGPRKTCTESLGRLLPVYSPETGTTYTNVHCATCNGDTNVREWNAELNCCNSAENSSSGDMVMFVADRSGLARFSLADRKIKKCHCSFRLKESKDSFLSKAEVRGCQRSEVSRCSMTWKDNGVSEACQSYLDPVYMGDETYRNVHCAACNYQNAEGAACVPPMMNHMHQSSWSLAEMERYCQEHRILSCLHYLSNSKGRLYPLHQLVAIESKGCLPPPGRRCCERERYDPNFKRCRKRGR